MFQRLRVLNFVAQVASALGCVVQSQPHASITHQRDRTVGSVSPH
jgi:hypothetical protein